MYSSIHNMDTDLEYSIYLDDQVYMQKVKAHHIESVIHELESQGCNIVDEVWDDANLQVDLVSSNLLDDQMD